MKLENFGQYISDKIPSPLYNDVHTPIQHLNFLRSDNPRLLQLKNRYSHYVGRHGEHSQWDNFFCDHQINLQYFRGDNAYIWQIRNNNTEEKYNLTAKYISSIDRLGLLHRTKEDGAFGVFTYKTDLNINVSRDLLDSITEIYFLENVLGISSKEKVTLIDIGAGYGRLAHRAIECIENISKFYCTDVIAESTFLNEFYSEYRNITNKCKVIPFYKTKDTIKINKPEIAINIHSFSECTVSSIEYWLEVLSSEGVKYLMIVPNNYNNDGGKYLVSLERDSSNIQYEKSLNKYGYRLIVKMPKYLDVNVQKNGISPTFFHLYELS